MQVLQSPQPAHLQNAVDGFSEFPVVCMPSNTKVRIARAQLPRGGTVLTVSATRGLIISAPASQDNQYPALDWQRYALRRMVRNYLTANRWLADQLRLARFARVPGTPSEPRVQSLQSHRHLRQRFVYPR